MKELTSLQKAIVEALENKKCPTPEKLIFRLEQKAWLKAWKLYKDKGFDQRPYLCPCGMYHLESKKAQSIPNWLIDIIKTEGRLNKSSRP